MKTKILITITAALACLLGHAQTSGSANNLYTVSSTGNWVTSSTARPRCTLLPNGTYSHGDAKVTVIELTQTSMVLECRQEAPRSPSSLYSSSGGVITGDPDLWREVYGLKDCKFVLERVIEPKITAATERRVEWPEEKP